MNQKANFGKNLKNIVSLKTDYIYFQSLVVNTYTARKSTAKHTDRQKDQSQNL